MSINNFSQLLFVFLMLCMTACSAGTKMILEYKDVQFPKVQETKNNNSVSLNISGLAFHSSLAVSNIETRIENHSLMVYVNLIIAKEGLSGSFSYELAVPNSIDEVRFGNEKILIWSRSKSGVDHD